MWSALRWAEVAGIHIPGYKCHCRICGSPAFGGGEDAYDGREAQAGEEETRWDDSQLGAHAIAQGLWELLPFQEVSLAGDVREFPQRPRENEGRRRDRNIGLVRETGRESHVDYEFVLMFRSLVNNWQIKNQLCFQQSMSILHCTAHIKKTVNRARFGR